MTILNSQQDQGEFEWFVDNFVRGKASLLEIGSCAGLSLLNMGRALAPASLIRSIDLGRLFESYTTPDWSERGLIDTRTEISKAIASLNAEGHDAAAYFGNSHSAEAREWANAGGPYDVVFIDGDHTYDGVRLDCLHYGPMGRVVGFHDIGNPGAAERPGDGGPWRLWHELMASAPGILFSLKTRWGIGVVTR